MPFRVRRLLKVRMVRWPRSIKAVLFPNISSSSCMLPCTALRRVPRKLPFLIPLFDDLQSISIRAAASFLKAASLFLNIQGLFRTLPAWPPGCRPAPSETTGGGPSECPRSLSCRKTAAEASDLRFSESPRRTQAAVHVHHRRTEELPARLSFGMSFFFRPCSSHADHRPSSWPRLTRNSERRIFSTSSICQAASSSQSATVSSLCPFTRLIRDPSASRAGHSRISASAVRRR